MDALNYLLNFTFFIVIAWIIVFRTKVGIGWGLKGELHQWQTSLVPHNQVVFVASSDIETK